MSKYHIVGNHMSWLIFDTLAMQSNELGDKGNYNITCGNNEPSIDELAEESLPFLSHWLTYNNVAF